MINCLTSDINYRNIQQIKKSGAYLPYSLAYADQILCMGTSYDVVLSQVGSRSLYPVC